MENMAKSKMINGETVLGTFFESGSTITVECLALAGLDYIIIDTEHGPFESESVMEFVCAAKRRNLVPFVRTKDASRPAILKMLDVGAEGLIVPDIRNIEEVRRLVVYSKYYPLGERGVAFGRGCGYGFAEPKDMKAYFEECNRETLLIPQCETLECLEDIENIVAVDGVGGIFIGPYDLSTALGKPGDFEADIVVQAIQRILTACKSVGKFAMIYAQDGIAARKYFAQGFSAAAVNMDTILLIQAIQSLVQQVKG